MPLIWSTLDFDNKGKAINIPLPVNPGDAVNKQYVDSLIEGLDWKDNVRAATTSNISISSAPASIDGVTLAVNDRILVKDQTTQSENGIYIFNGTGSALTRAQDANSSTELTNAVVGVDSGTANAGTFWRQTTVNPTIGTSNIVWEQFASSVPLATTTTAGRIRIATQSEVNAGTVTDAAVTPATLAGYTGFTKKYATTFGDTSNTTYTITHNLGTQDIAYMCRRVSDGKEVGVDVTVTGSNTISVAVNVAPGNNALRITVFG